MTNFNERQAELEAEREAWMRHDELLADKLFEMKKLEELERGDYNGSTN